VNGLGYVGIVWWFGWGWDTAAYLALFSALLVISVIDISHFIIPDVITLPGIPIGILLATTILPVGFWNSLLGVVVGGGLLWGMAAASPILFGKEGMGGGDIKLLAMIGAFLGWKPTLLTVLVGALLGSIVGISLIVSKVMKREQYLPFGPFLAMGALVALFFYHDLFNWYVGFLVAAR
jgi:leader peptidase (prepilin peptidase)/N-methyltransferase